MWQPAELFMMIKRGDGDDIFKLLFGKKKNREGLKNGYIMVTLTIREGSPLIA